MEDLAIRVEQVYQRFGKQDVLQGIDLAVNRGEIVGLLGPSGSGKTTLVKLIVGMGTPVSGKIEVSGKSIPSLSVIKDIGYMAQSDALYDDLNALDHLKFFAEIYGWKGKAALDRAHEVLSLVHLEQDARKPVRNFSGGMKRRLSLAIALFHKPKIIILDEPTVGLDPYLRKEFWQEFEMLRSSGVSLLITTHVMDEAEHCDRLALLRDGKVIAFDSPDRLKSSTQAQTLEDAFLYYSREEQSV